MVYVKGRSNAQNQRARLTTVTAAATICNSRGASFIDFRQASEGMYLAQPAQPFEGFDEELFLWDEDSNVSFCC
jgi:hypothetical protein